MGSLAFPGMVIKKGVGGTSGSFTFSDRFANLLPTETDSPKFLAADLGGDVLALRGRHDLFLFQFNRSSWNNIKRNARGTACRDGLLYVNPYAGSISTVDLFFVPFDPRQKEARFSLAWPTDGSWRPLAIAATPDASIVAAVAQESESDRTSVARYGHLFVCARSFIAQGT